VIGSRTELRLQGGNRSRTTEREARNDDHSVRILRSGKGGRKAGVINLQMGKLGVRLRIYRERLGAKILVKC